MIARLHGFISMETNREQGVLLERMRKYIRTEMGRYKGK